MRVVKGHAVSVSARSGGLRTTTGVGTEIITVLTDGNQVKCWYTLVVVVATQTIIAGDGGSLGRGE